MDGQFNPQWRPEPEPSNALERLLQKAQDPAVHGRMMRALWDTELHTLIAYHPELEGMMELQNGSPMPQFVQIDDGSGPFIPVFSSEAVAEYAIAKNAKKMGPQSLASMPGEALFQIINQLKCRVVVNPERQHPPLLRPESRPHRRLCLRRLRSRNRQTRHARPAHRPPPPQ